LFVKINIFANKKQPKAGVILTS